MEITEVDKLSKEVLNNIEELLMSFGEKTGCLLDIEITITTIKNGCGILTKQTVSGQVVIKCD